jgi:hypothetical protein
MTGGYRGMAQAAGEEPVDESPGWVPGVDFDPHDDDDMAVMREVWAREKRDRTTRLERENLTLRATIARLIGEED